MLFLKDYFIILMKIPNKYFYNIDISHLFRRGSSNSIIEFTILEIIFFRKNHPIICKIPFINWIIFKSYLKKKLGGN